MAHPVRRSLRSRSVAGVLRPRGVWAAPWTAGLAGALALLALGGCVDSATNAGGHSGSILGGWTLQADPTCRETLAFLPGGRFLHGVALDLSGDPTEQVRGGTVSGGDVTDDAGSLSAALSADRAAGDPALAYCGTWLGARRSALPFADVLVAAGIDPGALAYRPVLLPGGGAAWIGTDSAAQADRFALLRDGDVLHGFTLEDALPAGQTLFQRTPSLLPSQFPLDLAGALVVNLPQQALAQTFSATAPSQTLQSLLLSVHSAVDVRFGSAAAAPTGVPACTLVVWDSAHFNGAPVDPNPLAAGATPLVLTLNPGAGDPLLVSPAQSTEPEQVYLLPVEVMAPAAGVCSVNIRARPLVARIVAEHLAQALADRFTLTLSSGPAYLLGTPAGGQTLRALALLGSDLWPAERLSGLLVQPVPDAADPLGLFAADPQAVRLSLQSSGGGRYLSAFPAGGGSGVGPFVAYAAPEEQLASLPIDTPLTLAPATQSWLPFALTQSTVLQIDAATQGLATGLLLDSTGTQLFSAQSSGAGGTGFRIVSQLAADTYRLALLAGPLPVDVTLSVASLAGLGLPDAALEACLIDAAPGADPATLRVADCGGRTLVSLEGIAAFGALQALRLDDNPIADLAPLAGLPRLAELSLAGSAGLDLSPLGGVASLYRLSLARAPLDAAALTALQGLADRLTQLDLRGATGLSAADVTALKAALPNTTVLAPDGTVLE